MAMAAESGKKDLLCLSIRNELAELGPLNREVHAFLATAALPEEVTYAIDLSLEELVTNVIKYSFEEKGTHQIGVRISLEPGEAVLSVEDDGRPFDPLAAPAPDLDIPVEQRPSGGLGIHLVRAVAGKVTYRREAGKNRVEVRIPVA
jgi:anti-sigma regulatory factor (Ser/Thr protein kinase)